jgi:hypothetical protein
MCMSACLCMYVCVYVYICVYVCVWCLDQMVLNVRVVCSVESELQVHAPQAGDAPLVIRTDTA